MLSHDEAQELHGRIGAALENFKHMPAGYTAKDAQQELTPILDRALELAALLVSDTMVGVEPPTPTEREATRRYLQGEMDNVKPSEFDGKVKVKFTGEGESKHLNITAEQYGAIKKIIVPEDPSPVSYAPCITGTIEIGDSTTGFMVPLGGDSGWSNWGAANEVLATRVDLLDTLESAASEWASENLCRTCKENLLDDGEGYDGECGDCADRNPENREEDDDA